MRSTSVRHVAIDALEAFREMRRDFPYLSSYTDLKDHRKDLSHEEANTALSLYVGTSICR